MDIVTKLLAQLFDRFKAQSPLAAGVIIALLIAFAYFLENNGSQVFGESFATILQWVNWILLGLHGSRTTAILRGE